MVAEKYEYALLASRCFPKTYIDARVYGKDNNEGSLPNDEQRIIAFTLKLLDAAAFNTATNFRFRSSLGAAFVRIVIVILCCAV